VVMGGGGGGGGGVRVHHTVTPVLDNTTYSDPPCGEVT
jgi:hypothetical protein